MLEAEMDDVWGGDNPVAGNNSKNSHNSWIISNDCNKYEINIPRNHNVDCETKIMSMSVKEILL